MLHKGKLKKRGEDNSSHGSPSTFTIKQKLHSKSTYFYRWTYIVPSACSLALVLILGVTIFPSVNASDVYAADIDLQASGNSSISLTLGGAAEQVTMATADTVSYRTNTFTVSYSLAHQYEVFVHSMNGYTGELVGAQNPTAKIGGVGTDVATSDFGNNTWGYAVKEGTETEVKKEDLLYSSIPAYGNEGKAIVTATTENGQITENEGEKTYTLAFAAKIGSDSPADHYQTKVYLSVVNQPGRIYTVTYNLNGGEWDGEDVESQIDKELGDNFNFQLPSAGASPKWDRHKFMGWSTERYDVYDRNDKTAAELAATYKASGVLDFTADMSADLTLYAVWMVGGGDYLLEIETMQDMTNAVCQDSRTKVGDTKRLRDERDDKYYWVAKLADGNCWMTQNLDLDLNSETYLTPDTTNIDAPWSPSQGTYRSSADWNVSGSANNLSQSYSAGEYVNSNPVQTSSCTTETTLNTSDCVAKGWVDVSSEDWCAFETTSEVTIDRLEKKYDAHYLIGNHYSWAAATAETGLSLSEDGDVAPGSICPYGWKLPLAGARYNSGDYSYDNTSGSFYYLFNKYGVSNQISGTVGGIKYEINKNPIYLSRGGYIAMSNEKNLSGAGGGWRYWSSVVPSKANAYFTGSYNTSQIWGSAFMGGEGSAYRITGYSVRCVNDPSITE